MITMIKHNAGSMCVCDDRRVIIVRIAIGGFKQISAGGRWKNDIYKGSRGDINEATVTITVKRQTVLFSRLF